MVVILGTRRCAILARMAGQRTKRRSRKRRSAYAATGAATAAPRPGTRRAPATPERAAAKPSRTAGAGPVRRAPGTVGERPASPFGGLPASELAIAIGLVGVVVGYFDSNAVAAVTGAVVCGLGVLEVTAREHFSGFRSHSMLLAGFPAVILETLLVVLFGEPSDRMLLFLPIVPVFGICFWLLRQRFEAARQARLARPPAP